MVCNLPFSVFGILDNQVWGHTKNDIFSIKSAYYLKMAQRRRWKGKPSACVTGEKTWKTLWGLNLPEMMKTFTWKALLDYLSTRKKLYLREIIKDPLCPIYGRAEEIVSHFYWSCTLTNDVWSAASSPLQKLGSLEEDLQQIWMKLMETLSIT